MKLKFFVFLTLLGISLVYLSCNKDDSETYPDTIDLRTLNMPHFGTVKEYVNTFDKVKDLNGQEYLDLEKHYGIKTVYGDYTRARMELNKIDTWDKYLQFRAKWDGIVDFPALGQKKIECFPKYLGEISGVDLKLVSNNLSFKIGNYYYFYRGEYTVIVKKNNMIIDLKLDYIIKNRDKVYEQGYLVVERKINKGDIELRSGECTERINPPGYLCREREMDAGLYNEWFEFFIENGYYKYFVVANAYETSHRNVGGVWVLNYANLHFDGVLTGKYDICMHIPSDDPMMPSSISTVAENLPYQLPFNRTDNTWFMEQYSRDLLLGYPIGDKFGSSIFVCSFTNNNDNEPVDFTLDEHLGWPCSYDVHLECTLYE